MRGPNLSMGLDVGGGGVGALNLATAFGPVLSLQSDKGVTQTGAGPTVTAWLDQSATGELFSWNTVTKAYYEVSGINGLPSIGHLTAGAFSTLGSTHIANTLISSASAEMFMVLQGTATAANVFASNLGNFESSGLYYPFNANTFYQDFYGSTRPGISITDVTVPHILNVISTPTEWTVNVDGVQVYTTPTNTPGIGASPLYLCGNASTPFVGWTSALQVYPAKLATADRLTVSRALGAKYAITVP